MGIFDNMKDSVKDFAEQAKEFSAKESETHGLGMAKGFEREAGKYLLEDEHIIMAEKYWLDWACITNKRFFYVEANYKYSSLTKSKKELISVPFSAITEVNVDMGYVLGEVEVVTKNRTHELKLDKNTAQQFANAILNQIL